MNFRHFIALPILAVGILLIQGCGESKEQKVNREIMEKYKAQRIRQCKFAHEGKDQEQCIQQVEDLDKKRKEQSK